MKRIFLSMIFVLIAMAQLAAQTIPISQARTAGVGATVTITGVVTNGSELGTIRYMQDGTAGIAVYDFGFSPNRGDSVTLTGTLKLFNGLLEVDPVNSSTTHSSNNPLFPKVVTPLGMGPANEGELVKINNVTFSNPGGTFTNGTLNFSDGSEIGQIYLRSGHPWIGTTIPTAAVNLTGLSSTFNSSAQLVPRDLNDLEIAANFFLTGSVSQTNLTNSSFNLEWMTNAAGSSNVVYGTSANNMTTHVSGGGNTTNHSVALTGLNAGSIYYARAYSINGADTAWSPMGAYATVSNSTGQMHIYFNQVIDWGVSTGTVATYISGAQLEHEIINYINNAQQTIDFAAYTFTRVPIFNALVAAHNRGVRVRAIADASTSNTALQNGSAPFNWFTVSTTGIMHNKFIAIDADLEDDAWIFMGSMNFSDGEVFDNYNNVMFIQDQSLVRTYEVEFEEMWGSDDATPGLFSRLLGEDKTNNTPHNFIINGIQMELYFSPSDGTTAAISSALESADSEIEFALLTFTRNDLRDIIIAKHNSGINVRGMIENINDTGGEYQNLVNAGISMKAHTDPFLLHHKYAIIDEDAVGSDPIVVTGSHNWTTAAEERNDENTLIIHDATIANLYAQEFNARWIGLITGVNNIVLGLEGFDVTLATPAQNELRFNMSNDRYSKISVTIYDINGQQIQTTPLNNIQGETQHALDVANLANGTYLAVFNVDNVAVGERFIITR